MSYDLIPFDEKYLSEWGAVGLDFYPGEILLDDDGHYFRLRDVYRDGDRVIFSMECFNGETWEEYSSKYSAREWLSHFRFIKASRKIEELEQLAISAISDPSQYRWNEEEDTETTALVAVGGNRLQSLERELDDKKALVESIKRIVKRRMESLSQYAYKVERHLKSVRKVLRMFETYLGVYEEIAQIREGERARADEPISIRQLILFMDEETGSYWDGGIDWTKVEQFDEWILRDERRLAQVLPETKGMVILRPSRQYRERHDSLLEAKDRENNSMAYLLIRNGQNLWRIWTALKMDELFFPAEKELNDVLELLSHYSDFDRERAEGTLLYYHQNALLVQGLLDRCPDLFEPTVPYPELAAQRNMEMMHFIHDGEKTLAPGRKLFYEWQKEINQAIEQGARVVLANARWGRNRDWKDRFMRYYSEFNTPSPPPSDVYIVEKVIEDKRQRGKDYDKLVVYYQPGGLAFSGWGDVWGHERKLRVGFILRRSDNFIFNYDAIGLDDVEHYLSSRLERSRYLDVMPILETIKKKRLEELKAERQFVELLSAQLARETARDASEIESLIWDALHWWKIGKVKWKRPLTQDDQKAWRMIKARVISQLSEQKERVTLC